jgi:hypothetical protein
MHIPDQLRGERFILLGHNSKDPFPGIRWSDPKQQHSAEEMENLLNVYYPGCNYGVVYSTDLAVLDADNAARLKELNVLDKLLPTFTVQSGRTSSIGLHVYFRVPDSPAAKKIYLVDKETGADLGDIRLPGGRFYNVGPGSIHPVSQRRYEVILDGPIRTIPWEELSAALAPVNWELKLEKVESTPIDTANRTCSWGDEYNLSVLDFLMPDGARLHDGEYVGAHPIHGSTTGSNLTVRQDGSVWWCRRCGSGGGWIEALAVSEGIIDCSEAGKRGLTKEEWRQVHSVLKKIRPDVYRKQRTQWDLEKRERKLRSLRSREEEVRVKHTTRRPEERQNND